MLIQQINSLKTGLIHRGDTIKICLTALLAKKRLQVQLITAALHRLLVCFDALLFTDTIQRFY
jgi:hypothetical protein